jgi:hypothetical protein
MPLVQAVDTCRCVGAWVVAGELGLSPGGVNLQQPIISLDMLRPATAAALHSRFQEDVKNHLKNQYVDETFEKIIS